MSASLDQQNADAAAVPATTDQQNADAAAVPAVVPAVTDPQAEVLARLADVHKELAAALARAGIFVESRPAPALPAPRSDDAAALEKMRPARAPAPAPDRAVTRLPVHQQPWFGTLARLAMANAAAVVIVLMAMGKITLPTYWPTAIADITGTSAPGTTTVRQKPWLLVRDARGARSEPVPLEVLIQGRADGGVIVITGLIPGMILSLGDAFGADAWLISAAEAERGDLWVIPPEDFVGVVDLVAELRLADATVAHRRPIQVEWEAAPLRPTAPPVDTQRATPAPPAPVQPRLDREAIVVLVEHGKDLFAAGDLITARVVLERAAEASDAEAALALAATYDPVILRQLDVHGPSADAALARRWYERAKELGSEEAPRRLEILASAVK